jgi:molybdate transport system permease protein
VTRGRIAARVVVAVFVIMGVAFVTLPLAALIARAPWSDAIGALSRAGARTALLVSIKVSLEATFIAFALGLPLAWALERFVFPGHALLRGIVLLPLVLPPVVGGIGLLAAFGRRGVVGRALSDIGITLPFTTAGAAVAAAFVALPLVVLTLEAGLRSLDDRLEVAASAMGASPMFVFRRVTLPLLTPHVAAALIVGWARALGEFGATITFAGNLRGSTQTLPLAAYETLQTDPGAAILVSLILVAVALGALVALRGRFLPR